MQQALFAKWLLLAIINWGTVIGTCDTIGVVSAAGTCDTIGIDAVTGTCDIIGVVAVTGIWETFGTWADYVNICMELTKGTFIYLFI